jgi:hypothetical protein
VYETVTFSQARLAPAQRGCEKSDLAKRSQTAMTSFLVGSEAELR